MSYFRPVLFGLLLVALSFALRQASWRREIWNIDEGVTFTMAQQIAHGATPYRDMVDHRTPLVPYVQAVAFAIGGDWNLHAQQVANALFIGLSGVFLWLLGRRLGDAVAGMAAGLWWIFLSFGFTHPFDAMAAHTGWILVLFSSAGMWLFAESWMRRRPALALVAGVAFGLSYLAKQPGLLDFGVLLVLGAIIAAAEADARGRITRTLAWLGAGFVLPLAVTCAYFASKGVWSDFVFYSWTYNTKYYVPEVPFAQRLPAIEMVWHIIRDYFPAAAAGFVAAVALLWRAARTLWQTPRRVDALVWIALGWSAVGLISVVLSGRPFHHYAIQLLPGLSVACGWLVARLLEWRGRVARVAGLAAVALLAPLVGRSTLQQFVLLSRETPEGGMWETARALKDHSRSGDRVFVWGYVPEIYPLAQREPATRFIYTNFLTGLIPWTNLDARRDTLYAVVPGAWDKFWQDWSRDGGPTFVVDARETRGYIKYPLEQQTRLWAELQEHYASVALRYIDKCGYRLFRRYEPATPQPLPPGLPRDDALRITRQRAVKPNPTLIRINVPPDTEDIELYVAGRLYRRVPPPQARYGNDVAITLIDRELPTESFPVVAVARTPRGAVASAPLTVSAPGTADAPVGPALDFDGQLFPALDSRTFNGDPMLATDLGRRWAAHAPSSASYPRPDGLNWLTLVYELDAGSYAPEKPIRTDGVSVVARWVGKDGQSRKIFERSLDPARVPGDQGLQTEIVELPPGQGGEIVLEATPGPRSDPNMDWFFWHKVSGSRGPATLRANDRVVAASTSSSSFAHDRPVASTTPRAVVAVPAQFDFPLSPDMHELSGTFGLADPTPHTAPLAGAVAFEVVAVMPGEERVVYRRELDPAQRPGDRGPQTFQISLPHPVAGTLRFRTSFLEPKQPAEIFSYWRDLAATPFVFPLPFGARHIALDHSACDYGFSFMEEDHRGVLFCHPDSELVYALPAGARHLRGAYGLLARAYTDGFCSGATLAVEIETASGQRTTLFERRLDPANQTADRGPQALDVALPDAPGARLHLRTSGLNGRRERAWTYWTELRLEP